MLVRVPSRSGYPTADASSKHCRRVTGWRSRMVPPAHTLPSTPQQSPPNGTKPAPGSPNGAKPDPASLTSHESPNGAKPDPASPTSSESPNRAKPDPASLTSHAEAARLFEMANDMLCVFDHGGYIKSLNPAWERTLGWTPEEMMAKPLQSLLHPDDRGQTLGLAPPGGGGAGVVNFPNRYRHKDGSWRWLLWSAHYDSGAWYAAAKDVTESKQLERQALHDPLTRLPNRVLFVDRVNHGLAGLRRHGNLVALLFVDLDRFKVINDGLGHDVGDSVLRAVASRLAATLREDDTVARMGGDEVVILAEEERKKKG